MNCDSVDLHHNILGKTVKIIQNLAFITILIDAFKIWVIIR